MEKSSGFGSRRTTNGILVGVMALVFILIVLTSVGLAARLIYYHHVRRVGKTVHKFIEPVTTGIAHGIGMALADSTNKPTPDVRGFARSIGDKLPL